MHEEVADTCILTPADFGCMQCRLCVLADGKCESDLPVSKNFKWGGGGCSFLLH